MTAPWDSEGLWIKAKLFVNYALDDNENRVFDERALWASLALELLAKSALARASPLLIAIPNEDGKNLLAAAGLTSDAATFKSITAKTLFTRCARAFRPFDARRATQIADGRNAYLHSTAGSLTPIPEDVWWSQYWAQASVLVNACDRELDDFVGATRISKVEKALADNKRNVDQRLQMLTERAKQKLERFNAGVMAGAELIDWNRPRSLTSGLKYESDVTCPACAHEGATLEGEDVDSTEWHHDKDRDGSFDVWLELEVLSEHFSCPHCRLVLDTWELMEAAELPERFDAVGEPGDFYEDEYGND